MGHLVGKHAGNLFGRARSPQKSGVENDRAPWEAEGVADVSIDDVHIKLQALSSRVRFQPGDNA